MTSNSSRRNSATIRKIMITYQTIPDSFQDTLT